MKPPLPVQTTSNTAMGASHGSVLKAACACGLAPKNRGRIDHLRTQSGSGPNGPGTGPERVRSWRPRAELAAANHLGKEEKSSMQHESITGKRAIEPVMVLNRDEQRPLDLNSHMTIILWDEVEPPLAGYRTADQRRGRSRYLSNREQIEI